MRLHARESLIKEAKWLLAMGRMKRWADAARL
jgi:hypothetical protein